MRHEIPPATADEEKILKTVLVEWGRLTDLRRDIAIAVVRGHDTVPNAAAFLNISPDDVRRELPYIHGLLIAKGDNQIWIR